MRYIFLSLMVAIIFFPSTHLLAKNFIDNPDFEYQGLSGEEQGKKCWGTAVVIDTTSSEKRSGQFSLKITSVTSADTIAFYPDTCQSGCDEKEFPILERTDGTQYKSMQVKFGGYIKAASSTPTSQVKIVLKVFAQNDTDYVKITSSESTYSFPAGGWQLITGEFLWNSEDVDDPTEDTFYYKIY